MSAATAELPDDLLAGNAEDVALWAASRLADRYGYVRGPRPGRLGGGGAWFRRSNGRWHECPTYMPINAVQIEFDHAYNQLLGDFAFATGKIDRLLSRNFLDYNVMPALRVLLALTEAQVSA